jgi:predicted DNA-binding ribbon-helix-helix protein
MAVSIYTTVVQLILLCYSHDRRAANFSSAIRTTVVQLILLGYSHDRRDFH